MSLSRGHWGIENRLHWVRDVTFDEDRSQVRTGAAPQVTWSSGYPGHSNVAVPYAATILSEAFEMGGTLAVRPYPTQNTQFSYRNCIKGTSRHTRSF